jgi:hypothetical protein
VPTLQRTTRRCHICRKRTSCRMVELIYPVDYRGQEVRQWASCCMCAPCLASYRQPFELELDELVRVQELSHG